MSKTIAAAKPLEIPRGNLAGFRKYMAQDALSGFLVFLIALPLCIAISLASGFPSLCGVFTAIIGALITTFLSNSEMTIKGPAAGLIVIVFGAVEEFGGRGFVVLPGQEVTQADFDAYRSALAVGVAAAVLQIIFGKLRAGILGEFFPTSAVHGMLAAIGVIIIAKQVPVALGEDNRGAPLVLLSKIPQFIREANPAIATIGVTSLAIMFVWPAIRKHLGPLKKVPGQLVVLIVAIPMGLFFDLTHSHQYTVLGHAYPLNEKFLVEMPNRIFGMFDKIAFPKFDALLHPFAWKWVGLFFVIGTLESMLSAKAIDGIDPYRRKTDLNRDTTAVGAANLISSLVGGLPMISEIVRSRANIDNGAKTRFSDMWHGIFLLVCVALIPMYLHEVPLAALAAMLVYTGTRLAHPTEFINLYRVGREQLLVFVSTIIGVLATDLLIGVLIGIAVEVVIQLLNGVPASSLFRPYLDIESIDDTTTLVRAHRSAIFSNWIPVRRTLENEGLVNRQNIVLDLSETKFVDHSVMEKLHVLQHDFEEEGLRLEIAGLDEHRPNSEHAGAGRKRVAPRMRRISVTLEAGLEQSIASRMFELGAAHCVVLPCETLRRGSGAESGSTSRALVRLEILAMLDSSAAMMHALKRDVVQPGLGIICSEVVEVLQSDQSLMHPPRESPGPLSDTIQPARPEPLACRSADDE
jgi:MFS superfamily sulfate permease-like transporter